MRASRVAYNQRQFLRACKRSICFLSPLLCVLLMGCTGIQSAIDPAGPQANKISQLWWFMFWLLSAVFVLVMLVLLLAVWRRRTATDETTPASVDAVRNQRLARVVTGSVVATVVILFVLLVYSFLVGRSLHALAASDSKPLTIDVTGQQWWWQVKYENEIASQIVTTANEIHIPVGRVVLFKLRSNDVIHSFWVPNLHGKTDLIPGHVAATTLRADRPGVFRGQCAEFCGYQHAHMSFTVIAETEEQFRSWYNAQLESAKTPATAEQQRGQQVFLSSTCVMCHRIQGTDAGGAVGPDLTHLASRQSIAAVTLENKREHLAAWVVDSQSIKPGNRMPPNPLKSEDLQALLDYLQSLK